MTAAAKEFAQELQVDEETPNAAYELGEIYRSAGDSTKGKSFSSLRCNTFLASRKPS